MSFFAKKTSELESSIARMAAVMAAIGLTAEATAEQAAARVQALRDEGSATATEAARERVEALEKDAAAHAGQVTALRTGLAEAGIKLADGPVDAATVKGAVENRIAAAAAKTVASAGHEALNLPAASAEGEPKLTTKDALAAFQALTDPQERAAFYAKHRDVLLN